MSLEEIAQLPTSVFEAIGDAVVVVGRSSDIVCVNRSAEAMLGYTASELVGQPVETLIPEGLREDHRQQRRSYVSNPEPRTMGQGREFVTRRKDGSELPVEVALGPLSVGGELHVVCVLHDLSGLRVREAYLQEVVDAMPGIFYLFDSEGRLVWWNRNFETVFGYTADELQSRGMLDFVHPKDHEELARRVGLVYTDGKTRTAEYDIVCKDGSTLPYCGNGALCEIGGEQHMVGLTMDVSQLRRAERELERRLAEIEELKHQLELENAYLRDEHLAHHHGDIVGESPAIRTVLSQIEKVAPTRSTVLILGETGTGKELFAQRLHELSPRSRRAMVKVNCGALPATLMDSELFGREKGAYTGAVSREAGRFEVADGSTLFLDEVGELPLELQSKLLRVLQDGRFERVGSSRTMTVDVRVIAATNRDLAEAVRNGSFRRDLYYRLNVFPIRAPSLSERREDIPLLVWSFVDQIGHDMGMTIETISERAMERLRNHPWPGNVRELRNVIERSMIGSRGRKLTLALPEAGGVIGGETLSLDEVQRRHICKVLEVTGGRISGKGGAAEVLRLKPTTLRSRMEKLGIQQARSFS